MNDFDPLAALLASNTPAAMEALNRKAEADRARYAQSVKARETFEQNQWSTYLNRIGANRTFAI